MNHVPTLGGEPVPSTWEYDPLFPADGGLAIGAAFAPGPEYGPGAGAVPVRGGTPWLQTQDAADWGYGQPGWPTSEFDPVYDDTEPLPSYSDVLDPYGAAPYPSAYGDVLDEGAYVFDDAAYPPVGYAADLAFGAYAAPSSIDSVKTAKQYAHWVLDHANDALGATAGLRAAPADILAIKHQQITDYDPPGIPMFHQKSRTDATMNWFAGWLIDWLQRRRAPGPLVGAYYRMVQGRSMRVPSVPGSVPGPQSAPYQPPATVTRPSAPPRAPQPAPVLATASFAPTPRAQPERRTALVLGAVAAGLALVGAAAWAMGKDEF